MDIARADCLYRALNLCPYKKLGKNRELTCEYCPIIAGKKMTRPEKIAKKTTFNKRPENDIIYLARLDVLWLAGMHPRFLLEGD